MIVINKEREREIEKVMGKNKENDRKSDHYLTPKM